MVTAFSLACGLFVIFKVNMMEPGTGYYESIKSSAFLLLLAAFADFIDGALARAFHASSDFGVIFDSLADAVSFGVAPSVLMLKSLSLQQGTVLSFCAVTGAMVYALCGVLRLARFSVKAIEVKGKVVEIAEHKKHYTGLPIPAAAAAAVSANLLFLAPYLPFLKNVDLIVRGAVLTAIMLFLGYLMVSRWKFPSLKMLHFRLPSFHLAFLTVLFAIGVLYGVLYFFPIVLAIVSWSYILTALVLAIARVIAGKKSKTLKEFEPEPEEND